LKLFTKLIDIIDLRGWYLFAVFLKSILVCTRLTWFFNFIPRCNHTFALTFFYFTEVQTRPAEFTFNGYIWTWAWTIYKFIIEKLEYIVVQTVSIVHRYVFNMWDFFLCKVAINWWLCTQFTYIAPGGGYWWNFT